MRLIYIVSAICWLLLSQGSAQLSIRQLDSLSLLADTASSLPDRTSALKMLLGYYSGVPQIDSVTKYSVKALALAPDMPPYQRALIEANVEAAFGLTYRMMNSLDQAVLCFDRAEARLRAYEATMPTPDELADLQRRYYNLRQHRTNTYVVMGLFMLADSLCKLNIAQAVAARDTSSWASQLQSRAALYGNYALLKQRDSAEQAIRLVAKRDSLTEEGIALIRSFLRYHPNDPNMHRTLLYLLTNKALGITNETDEQRLKKDTKEETIRKELLSLLLESLRIAREQGISGQAAMLPLQGIARLQRVLGRYEQSIETCNELITEAHRQKLPMTEAQGYLNRSENHLSLKNYDDAFSDFHMAMDIKIQAGDYIGAAYNYGHAVQIIDEMPLLQRQRYRQERARCVKLSEEYHRKATTVGSDTAPKPTAPPR